MQTGIVRLATVRRVALGVVFAIAVVLVPLSIAAHTAPPASALEAQTGLPLTPRTDTPFFDGGSVTDQTVVGDRVIVVGTFQRVFDNDGTLVDQPYYAAYDIDTGELDLDASPSFDRPVLAVEPDGQGGVIVGGQFVRVDGAFQLRIARLDANGDLDASFAAATSARVDALAVRNNRVYAGGPFLSPSRGLAAFVLADGSVDDNFNFPLAGPAGRGGDLSVKSLGLAGSDLVVVHSGLSVGGQDRVGAAIIDLTPVGSPSLRPWRTDFFKDNTTDVGSSLAITDGAVSPDGSYFVVVSAGGDRPLEGKDAAVRFPTDGDGVVEPDWVSRHFDSLFGVGISDQAVFIGGHFQFQEAPGSTNPYPGDPLTNFGTGVLGQGPQVLGNEVVAREQIGALNPETGKSFNWNPGASALVGVESIVVVERGLLVGQDGDRLGGQIVGRHGFFDIESGPQDVELELTSSFDSHFNGQVVPLDEVVVSGLASDDEAGVERVQLAIRNRDTGQYVHPDGSLAGWIGINANLQRQGANQTAWSYPINFLTPGNYRIQARTFTVDGRRDLNPPELDLVVRGDNLPTVERPVLRQLEGGTIEASGSASDDLGVASVTLRIVERGTGGILQADGSLSADDHRFEVELSEVGAPEVTWTGTFAVPRDGDYSVEVSATDTSGQDDGRFITRSVTVTLGDSPAIDPNLEAPEVNLTSPTQGQQFADSIIAINGRAIDDSQVVNVQLRIQREADGRFLRSNGDFRNNSELLPAILSNPGRDATNFTFLARDLEAGEYTVTLQAIDDDEQVTEIERLVTVLPEGAIAPPVTTPPVEETISCAAAVAAGQLTLNWTQNDYSTQVVRRNGSWIATVNGNSNSFTTGTTNGDYVLRLFGFGSSIDIPCETGAVTPGNPVAGDPVNLSQGQPATQSSTLRGDARFAASRAVDGNTSGAFADGSINLTESEQQPWWEVDLGASSSLSEIQIWNRTNGCCSARLSNYSVFVSDAPMEGRTLAQLQRDGAVTEYFFSDVAGSPTTIDVAGVVGQYVRIQLHGRNSLHMGEVVVLGTQ